MIFNTSELKKYKSAKKQLTIQKYIVGLAALFMFFQLFDIQLFGLQTGLLIGSWVSLVGLVVNSFFMSPEKQVCDMVDKVINSNPKNINPKKNGY